MAASPQYGEWLRMGQPYRLCQPAKEWQATIRRYHVTVYDYPDSSHLTASFPQDHTPFSYTKWPVGDRRVDGVGRALDIMPGPVDLDRLARRIIADVDARIAGTEAIKYMNWTDKNGVCRQENWQSRPRTTKGSTDKGHIHLSFRSDLDLATTGGYDPVARMMGEADDMYLDTDRKRDEQVHAFIKLLAWATNPDRAEFVAPYPDGMGGDATVWDYGGGMGGENVDANEMVKLLRAAATNVVTLDYDVLADKVMDRMKAWLQRP